MNWLQNFLKYVDTPIVIFSEGQMLQTLIQMRNSAGLSSKFFPIEKPFSTLKFSTPDWIEKWSSQVVKSDFRHLHNQELFRVWANKSFFVEEAIEKNPFSSEIFVWCDAGCWRDEFTAAICGPSWPIPEKIEANRMQIVSMTDIPPWIFKVLATDAKMGLDEFVESIDTANKTIVSGTILAGDAMAWKEWIPLFEQVLNAFFKCDRFAGDDQAVISSTAFWLWKQGSPIRPIFYRCPPHSGFLAYMGRPFGDNWFCFQQHFSRIDFKLPAYA